MAGATGGRRRPVRPTEEGSPARIGSKGKNFVREEQEKLCHSVLHVSHDRITGNQQKVGVFWKRIFKHYDEHRLAAFRPFRSLECKWSCIKHGISKFIGIFAQVLKLNKSGSNTSDTLKRAHELYRIKHAKGFDFGFEHCWILLKDHPKWADRWIQVRPPTPKRKVAPCDLESDCVEVDAGQVEGSSITMDEQCLFLGRSGSVKAAKEDQKQSKVREAAMYA
jgi:hypothetical protein